MKLLIALIMIIALEGEGYALELREAENLSFGGLTKEDNKTKI